MDDKEILQQVDLLWMKLSQAPTLKQFLAENKDDLSVPPLTDYLDALCRQKNVVREHVISRSCIERSFGHQIFRGDRKASRNNVIRLAFGFRLSPEETQQLLIVARKPLLYPKFERDAAIIFGLMNHYSVTQMEILLSENSIRLLGDQTYERGEVYLNDPASPASPQLTLYEFRRALLEDDPEEELMETLPEGYIEDLLNELQQD